MTDSRASRARLVSLLGHGTKGERLAVAAVLAVSGFLNLFRLQTVGTNGYGNTYYAAGVQSMLTSPHHFLYLSLDPAGFLAMDKAPLSLWLQAASARVFGFHGLSLLLPQAIAGILAVYVLLRMVRRTHGAPAGLMAGLSLAVTPISVVTNRTNLPDPLLILLLLLAAATMLRSIEKGSLSWLLGSAALVGLAFNVKMLQILLAVPALAAVHVLASPHPWKRRLWHGLLALIVLLAVSAPWVLMVALTPPEQRPYVGSSATNSVVELIFSYNGVQRLFAQDWSAYLGRPSPVRLFNSNLGGQVSWLLPFALVGLLVACWQERQRAEVEASASSQLSGGRLGKTRVRRAALLLWSMWLLTSVVYFSLSLFFHRYYLSTLAPAIAALMGIGTVALWSAWSSNGWRRWWVVVALLSCAAVQALFLAPHAPWRWVLLPVVVAACLAAAAVLAWPRSPAAACRRRGVVALGVGLAALLVAPSVWALIPVTTCTNLTLPTAGPQAAACRSPDRRPFLDPHLVNFLEEGRQGAPYLAATFEMGIASLGILQTGKPFLALGGYRGNDPILKMDDYAQMVTEGEVRFFLSLVDGAERWPEQEPILAWVAGHCPLAEFTSPGVEVRGPCGAGD